MRVCWRRAGGLDGRNVYTRGSAAESPPTSPRSRPATAAPTALRGQRVGRLEPMLFPGGRCLATWPRRRGGVGEEGVGTAHACVSTNVRGAAAHANALSCDGARSGRPPMIHHRRGRPPETLTAPTPRKLRRSRCGTAARATAGAMRRYRRVPWKSGWNRGGVAGFTSSVVDCLVSMLKSVILRVRRVREPMAVDLSFHHGVPATAGGAPSPQMVHGAPHGAPRFWQQEPRVK